MRRRRCDTRVLSRHKVARERCRQMNTRELLSAIFVLLLTTLVAPASDAIPGEWVLSPDFQLGDANQLCLVPATVGLSAEPHSYPDHNATEWQVRLQDVPGAEQTLLVDVKSADFVVQFPTDNAVTLHWNRGSHAEASDFQPLAEVLKPGSLLVRESFGGRSSDGTLPYFNLAGEGGGLIVAIGWSGDWSISFQALPQGRVRITGGLKRSRFHLQDGARLRLPSVLTMAYRGDWIAGQNQFRRLMLQHFTPVSHPPMQLMPVAASVHGMIGFNETTEANLIALARDIAALQLPLDTYWLDAGWNAGGFPLGQGNAQADPQRFPHGLAALGDTVRASGMRLLVWFEPERVMRGTWLDREHASWLLQPSATPDPLRYQERDGFRLLDLGNAQARAWAVDAVSQEIRSANIAVYRQDFNLYPAFFWQTDESPDEIGLRELRYINGLYEFLDTLVDRHPGIIIDNCASGGRRLDFEMMRRCVALWRSDSCWDGPNYPRNVQAMSHGLSQWLPLHGLGAAATDNIALRSGMGACAAFAINFRDPQAVTAPCAHLDRYLNVRPLFAADYFPLTEWSDDPGRWLAYQFYDRQRDEGLVQAFAGAAAEPNLTLRLQGLEAARRYRLTDWDHPETPIERSGRELCESGLQLDTAANTQRALVFHMIPATTSRTESSSGQSRHFAAPPVKPWHIPAARAGNTQSGRAAPRRVCPPVARL